MSKLSPCPFCGSRDAIVVVRSTSKGAVFTRTVTVGCTNDKCKARLGQLFEHEMKVDKYGKLRVVSNGYLKATNAWNRKVL